jgi:predicted TIM-barrel fold metal-dependent hydrolase
VFSEDPADALRRQLWIAPYYEEDLPKLADVLGIERILFGSDWPHGEGLADPAGYVDELVDDHGFDQHSIDRIMRDNAAELLGLPVGVRA